MDLLASMVQHRGDVNVVDYDDCTALHASVRYRNAEIRTRDVIDMLVEAGARVDAQDTEGSIPLHLACTNGNVQ